MDPKNVIRGEVRKAMSTLTASERSAASPKLAAWVRSVVARRKARCVMGFLADPHEIDFDAALAARAGGCSTHDAIPRARPTSSAWRGALGVRRRSLVM